MHKFSPETLFDLEQVPFNELFKGLEYAWEALKGIAPYLDRAELGEILGEVSSGAYLVNPELIYIGKGTVVEPGAYIKGPCWIGEGCVVRHGAYVRGNVLCGSKAVIGHDTEVKNSILLNGAQAAHFAYVGDSILGNGVNLGAGTKLANLKFDHSEVFVRFEGKKFPTGLKKMGAILGDGAQTGCNSVTNPGTIFERGAACYPCVNARGVVLSDLGVHFSK